MRWHWSGDDSGVGLGGALIGLVLIAAVAALIFQGLQGW